MNKMLRSTTVLAILDKGGAAMGADGQVTMGETIMKAKARNEIPISFILGTRLKPMSARL